MILGHIDVDHEAVHTHRDSYLLRELTVVSVRRPFQWPGLGICAGGCGFVFGFSDLLFAEEIAATLGLSILVGLLSLQIGQLKLLSRDLRGSELAGVIYGRYRDLNIERRRIVRALRERRNGGAS